IRPGQLNLMTAGKGVAHSEESLSRAGESLHGVQLWVALPDGQRHCEPDFEHHAELPGRQFGDVVVRVFAGELAGMRSPAQFWSPIVGGELLAQRNASIKLPVNPAHEHAL